MISSVYPAIRCPPSAIRLPISPSGSCLGRIADSGQIFHPKCLARQRGDALLPASHGPAMSDKQPKREPQSPKQQADKSAARTAQHDDLFALRLCHTYHVGGGNVIPLLAAALQQLSRVSFRRRTWQ